MRQEQLMKSDASGVEESETRWPRDDDRLFVESTWAFDAHLVRDPAERFYRMPMGYKRAGDLLLDQAATNVVDRANVIYAALFCYRQSIELFLKRLIAEFGNDRAYKKKHVHELNVLWDRFMDVVNDRAMANPNGLVAAQKLIAEMHMADEKSDGFRFPTDLGGAAFSFGDRGIDLPNLREVMQGLVNFFECTDLAWSHRDSPTAE
jgi:hypothetical protein